MYHGNKIRYLVFGTIVTCLCFHHIRTGAVFTATLPSCFDMHPLRTWTVYRVRSTAFRRHAAAANDGGSVRMGPNVAEPFSTVTFDPERTVTDGRRQRFSIVSRAHVLVVIEFVSSQYVFPSSPHTGRGSVRDSPDTNAYDKIGFLTVRFLEYQKKIRLPMYGESEWNFDTCQR